MTHAVPKARLKTFAAVTVVMGLLAGGSAAANAAVTPDHGPDAGSTVVTVPAPDMSLDVAGANGSASFAADASGATYAWGSGFRGQHGDGQGAALSKTPVLVSVPGSARLVEITGGDTHVLGLDTDGRVFGWGGNTRSQLGLGDTQDRLEPTPIALLDGVTANQVEAGFYHSLALGSNGRVYGWGDNGNGQLGNPAAGKNASLPVEAQLPADVRVTALAAGSYFSLALSESGDLYAWGYNDKGQLGDGSTVTRSTPVKVENPDGAHFVSVAAGNGQSYAVTTSGEVYAWGTNDSGQLGTGDTTGSVLPKRVNFATGVSIVSIAAGHSHTLALDSDGTAYAWGLNTRGQLGLGDTAVRLSPEAVTLPGKVLVGQVAAGEGHSIAIGADGNAYGWGANGPFGQVGDDTTTNRDTPVRVKFPIAVTEVTFDGLAGTNLGGNDDWTYSVTTPAHEAGAVDVGVHWTLYGVQQETQLYPGGFTYEAPATPPTITDPSDQRVREGDLATFDVVVTGTPTPTVTWQVSRDGGKTWEESFEVAGATVSESGLAIEVSGNLSFDGYEFRAIATNSEASVESAAATLRVDATDDGSSDDGSTDDGSTDDGNVDDGSTDDGSSDDGNVDDGSTDDGSTDDGSSDDGNVDDGSTDGGSTDGGNVDDGTVDDGSTDGGNVDDGNVDDGDTDGADSDGSDSGGSATDGGNHGGKGDGTSGSGSGVGGHDPLVTTGGSSLTAFWVIGGVLLLAGAAMVVVSRLKKK
ncbi:RCC1 domain-containing protein [Leucobacter chinensis]|uniref:RCC1 domain-containing protein n=1 Tax=Leucobacter chinensis TaxID=2851010 RepID=UPI001C21440E|nr:hypothetical protein [Leucobacter chinensis]